MLKGKVAVRTLLIVMAVVTVQVIAQQDEAPILRPRKPKPVPVATLLVMCDLDCNWKLDSEPMGRIDAGGSAKAKVGFGKHTVVGTTEDGLAIDGDNIEIKAAGQTIVRIVLQPFLDARLKAEQAERIRTEKAANEDRPKTSASYQKSCDSGNVSACSMIVLGKQEPTPVTPAEKEQRAVELFYQGRYSEAKSYFDRACTGGIADACSYIGRMYDEGLGVKENDALAAMLYSKACDAGSADGCTRLRSAHYRGDASRFSLECDAGNANSCVMLGALYRAGLGVGKDPKEAMRLFEKACAIGSQTGCEDVRVF